MKRLLIAALLSVSAAIPALASEPVEMAPSALEGVLDAAPEYQQFTPADQMDEDATSDCQRIRYVCYSSDRANRWYYGVANRSRRAQRLAMRACRTYTYWGGCRQRGCEIRIDF